MANQAKIDLKLSVRVLSFYALQAFKNRSPELTGDLKRSFTGEFEKQGLVGHVGSNLPYAERIWVHGHSQKLPPAAVDTIIADMANLPIKLK